MRLILAPPESSSVSTWSPEPSIRFSKSTPNCWTILGRDDGVDGAEHNGRTPRRPPRPVLPCQLRCHPFPVPAEPPPSNQPTKGAKPGSSLEGAMAEAEGPPAVVAAQ